MMRMQRINYLDFDLRIEREGDQYIARTFCSLAGEAWTKFKLPFSDLELENLVLKISRLRSGARRIHSPEIEAARKFGGSLFEVVFAGDVRACLRRSLDEASQNEEAGLRIKLRLQDVPELADMPWEFLFDPSLDRFFTQSEITPIVRYLEIPERIKPLTVALPMKILVMISSPADYPHLDFDREKRNLEKGLEPLAGEGRVRLEILEDATLAGLQRRLRKGTYHMFHYIGHGGFDQKSEEGVLVLEDSQKRSWLAGAQRIATLLRDHRPLRLAILNSCEGARNSRVDPFAGVAATLVRQGIPAVVAMQFEITDEAAITFSSEFYAALAEGMPVDAAVAAARKAIFSLPNDIEWGTPVLYMRSPDGILFELSKTPTIEIAHPPGEKPESSEPKPAETPPKRKSERKELPTDTAAKVEEKQPLDVGAKVIMALAGLLVAFWAYWGTLFFTDLRNGFISIFMYLFLTLSQGLLSLVGGVLVVVKSRATMYVFGVEALCGVLLLLTLPDMIVLFVITIPLAACACVLSARRFRPRS